jgi:hypothetical protein
MFSSVLQTNKNCSTKVGKYSSPKQTKKAGLRSVNAAAYS